MNHDHRPSRTGRNFPIADDPVVPWVESRMFTLRDTLRWVPLACAGAMSFVLSATGLLIVVWAIDLQHPKPGDLSAGALFLLGPILSAPAFASVFISQRWHRCLMWMLAFGSFTGTYFAMHGERNAWSPFRQPVVLASIAIATLVEVSYRVRRKPKQPSNRSIVSE